MDKYVIKEVYKILIAEYNGGYMHYPCKILFNIFCLKIFIKNIRKNPESNQLCTTSWLLLSRLFNNHPSPKVLL